MKEAEFQDKQVDYLRSKGCEVTPLVGHSLMAGMPDLWILTMKGAGYHAENKVWRNKADPTPDKIVSLLDGPQAITIKKMWKRNHWCPIIAFRDTEFIDAAICFVYDGTEYWSGPWKQYADRMARTKPYDLFYRSV